MTRSTRFSQRYDLRKPAEGLIFDSVPDRVVAGLINLLKRKGFRTAGISKAVHEGLDHDVPAQLYTFYLDRLLRNSEWYEFCDACEIICERLPENARDSFSNELNKIFSRNYFGYELRDGQLERVGARVQDEAIAKARGILRDSDLAGPDEQFQKAIGFYNPRPEPDLENCVKEAFSAVEGVARVLLGDDSLTLSKALKQIRQMKDVHPTLIGLLDKLYAYRGDAEGVAHGQTRPKEVRPEDAEFALGVSASAIVYLAPLYGRAVE